MNGYPSWVAETKPNALIDRAFGLFQRLASPIYASWNQLDGWLRTVDGLRPQELRRRHQAATDASPGFGVSCVVIVHQRSFQLVHRWRHRQSAR